MVNLYMMECLAEIIPPEARNKNPCNKYTLCDDFAPHPQNPCHHRPVPCGGGAERTCENDTLIVYASHLLPVLFIVCYVDSCVDGIKHDAGSVDF